MLDLWIERKDFIDPRSRCARRVIERFGLSLHAGELVALLGPSGCGKTTLLQLIAGLDTDFEGAIRWPGCGHGVRPRLGYVFQNPRLLPWLSLRDNIRLVLDADARRSGHIDALLAATGLRDFAEVQANRLSVGMQRRGALARAFAIDPPLLLMDEPFVSLDAPTAEQLRHLLLTIWERERPTVLFVTHDLHEATLLADRLLFLSSPPTRIIGDVAIGIPRALRRVERLIDERHIELKSMFQSLYSKHAK